MQCGHVVEYRVLGREQEPARDGDFRDPSVGLVVIGAEAMTAANAPCAQVDVHVGDFIDRGTTPARPISRSRTPRRRAPQPATSAPKRISATTVNGSTQTAGSRIGAYRALRYECFRSSQALAIIVSTTTAGATCSGVLEDSEELVLLRSNVLDQEATEVAHRLEIALRATRPDTRSVTLRPVLKRLRPEAPTERRRSQLVRASHCHKCRLS